MSHYFSYSPLTANAIARASDVNVRFQGVVTAFDMLPDAVLIAQDRVTYGSDIGVANAMILNPVLPVTSYVEGLRVRAKAFARNTGATTVNISGLGVKQIVRSDGTALQAGDIVAGQIVDLTYDGTAFRLAMAFAELSPAGVLAKLNTSSGNLTVTGTISATIAGSVVATFNGGSNTYAIFKESAQTNGISVGSIDGDAYLFGPVGKNTRLYANGAQVATVSSIGLAVAGAITANAPTSGVSLIATDNTHSTLTLSHGAGGNLFFGTDSHINMRFGVGVSGAFTEWANINSTGLAVVGTISASGQIASSAGAGTSGEALLLSGAYGGGIRLFDNAGTPTGSGRIFMLNNGTEMRIGLNAIGATQQLHVTSTGLAVTGVITPRSVASGSYGTATAGAMQFSSTLGVPIYADGTNWRRFDTNAIVS